MSDSHSPVIGSEELRRALPGGLHDALIVRPPDRASDWIGLPLVVVVFAYSLWRIRQRRVVGEREPDGPGAWASAGRVDALGRH